MKAKVTVVWSEKEEGWFAIVTEDGTGRDLYQTETYGEKGEARAEAEEYIELWVRDD